MKKIFTLFIVGVFIGAFSNINAQLKFDFEEWTKETDTSNFTTPNPLDFWGEPNATIEVYSAYGIPGVVAQCGPTDEAHDGLQAAKLTAKEYDVGGYKPDVQGWLFTGFIGLDPMTYAVIADIRVENTVKWEKFSGWYKYAPSQGDSCVFLAELYAADSVIIATAKMKSAAVAQYTQFDIPFVYSDEGADVTDIGIYISASNTTPHTGPNGPDGTGGSILIIDDLELSVTPSSVRHSLTDNITVEVYQVDMSNSLVVKNAEDAVLEIYSITGRHILTHNIRSPQVEISISQLNKGIYFYRITMNDAALTAGKFIKY